ncbi:hypothetical protein niasHT_014876 [Heterodera trifolii]|uniref:DNA2/NAM7 helicase-like C-terminal domain-containing protein n=1 Tax=Heterodera trifolii TaxID=157864 RepID=A0ABD2L6Z2_9BILA
MGVIRWPVTLFRITSPSLKSAVDQQKQAMRRNSDNDNGANNDANIGSDANNAREAEIVHGVDTGNGTIDALGEGMKIGQCPNCSWHCNVCIYQGTVRLEDAANRSLRVINRRAVQNTDAINQVSVTVNANMDTLSTRLDQVVEKVESLESQVENWDDTNADKLSQNGNATVVLRSRVGLIEEEDDEDEFLNVLTTLDPFASQLPACRDENLTSFDNWAQKFRDLLDYAGTTCRRRNENVAAPNAAVGGKEVATATQNIESLEVASATEQIELIEAESIPQNLESFVVASATQEVLIMETASAVEKSIETDKTRGISAGLEEEFERGMELGEDFTATQFSNVSWSEPRVTVSPTPMFHNDELGVEDGVLKYLVCQTDVKSVAGGKMSGQGPFFMGIPDSVVSAERRLQMGDTVVVSKFEWKEGFERLSYDLNPVDSLRSWYVQGRINVQAVAQQVEVVELCLTNSFTLNWPKSQVHKNVRLMGAAAADRDAAFLAVSPLNVAVCELVKDTMESLSEKVPMLALFSGQGKGRYMDRIKPLGDNILVEAVQRDGNVPSAEGNEPKKWSDNKTFKQYVDDFNTTPRRARERSTTAALLKQTKYRVYFMALALAEKLALDLGNVTYVLVDECGQATLSAVLSILTQFRSVKKILLTGDKQQLRVHLPSQMTVVRGKFGFESILEVLETAKGIDRTVLSKCYRSHSAIVKCLDVGVYSPAGDRLVPGRPDIEMSSFLNFIGPRIVAENCPIILIHQKSSAQMENISFSSHNPEQRETALGFLGLIQGTFTGLIQVVCFYQAERKHMVSEIELRRWPNVKVSTVDSIQSQEAELVLVITTRSAVGRSTEADTGKEFWADCARTTVALSRPKFGLVIIGDLSLIWHKGTVWRRFIDETLKMTVAVTPEYLNLISNPFPSRVGKFIAKRDGTVPMAFEFYAERDSTLRHESGFMPFTTQANAFPPISPIHAQPPAFSHGLMIIDTSVRPPPTQCQCHRIILAQVREWRRIRHNICREHHTPKLPNRPRQTRTTTEESIDSGTGPPRFTGTKNDAIWLPDNPTEDNRNVDNRTVNNRTVNNRTVDNRTVDNPTEDNRNVDNRTVNNRTVNNRTVNNRTVNNRTVNNRTVDNRTVDNPTEDNRNVDNRTVNNRTVNNRTVDNPTVNNWTVNNRTVDNRTVDNPTVNNRTVDNRTVNNRTVNNRTVDNRTVDNPTEDNRNVDNRTVNNRTVNNRTVNNRTVDNPTVNNRTVNNRTVDNRTVDNPTVNNRTVDNRTVDNPTEDNRNVDNRTVNNRTVNNRTVDNRTVNNRTVNNRTVDNRTMDNPTVNNRTVDNRTVNNRTVNNRTVDNRTVANFRKTSGWFAGPGVFEVAEHGYEHFRKREHAKTEQVVGRDGGRRKKSDERHRRLTAGARRAPANQSTACGSRADFLRSPSSRPMPFL